MFLLCFANYDLKDDSKIKSASQIGKTECLGNTFGICSKLWTSFSKQEKTAKESILHLETI